MYPCPNISIGMLKYKFGDCKTAEGKRPCSSDESDGPYRSQCVEHETRDYEVVRQRRMRLILARGEIIDDKIDQTF